MKNTYRATFSIQTKQELAVSNIFLNAISIEQAKEHASLAFKDVLIANGIPDIEYKLEVRLSSASEVEEYQRQMTCRQSWASKTISRMVN